MKIGKTMFWSVATGVAALLAACTQMGSQQGSDAGISVGSSDLGGVVTSSKGPEAGVWVIAETTDLPTKFTRIVVTDDRGRYVMPGLPKASYQVWVRGYGLVDSPKVRSEPGGLLNLTAVPAPNAAAAAEYYPPIYWYSMLKIPAKNEFPAGPMKSQPEWLNQIKTTGCMSCHALGTKGMRTMPKDFAHMNSTEAWARRIASGQAMTQMINVLGRFDRERVLANWADWTDRVAKGELPFARPERPQGIERNIMLTLWDWSTPTGYMHDLISTDRRKPTVNAGGKLYGAPEESTDYFPVLDPKTHAASQVKHPVRDPKTPSSVKNPMAPSPYWGPKPIWDSQTSIHNQMMDEKGRVWMAARIRHPNNPDYCKKGGSHPSAKVFPLNNAGRHVSMYDPASGKFTLISTCFPTHHVILAEDANNTLWFSSGVTGPGAFGWINRKLFEETGDEARAQGWSPFVLDTNGNGRRDAYVEPNQPADSSKDTRVQANLYSVGYNPKDGSIWGTQLGFPGRVVRVAPGADPTHTSLTEVFEVPFPGYGPRGGDIDRNGVYWSSLASGHLGRFDRSKCMGPLNGPKATGKHCPEGWTLYRFPGPQFRDVQDDGSAEASYYVWVDQFNTFGLGANVPFATGNLSDSYFALVNGKFVTVRVPYPMGFFAKWGEGRIDDPAAGWKGRALWATNSTRTVFHNEGGTQNRPKVVKFQLRPNPLAR
ncbi:MAG TPA: carboxypeptidase-like regulatory domain-containing protein [Burkholderiales bacterium]|nr:carboxypeptidase-like regulatory domain-containing protein [Burkholderiales bacterium]